MQYATWQITWWTHRSATTLHPAASSVVTWSNPTLALLGDVPATFKINARKSGAGGKGFGKLRGMSFIPEKDKTIWCSTVWSQFAHDSVGSKEEQFKLNVFGYKSCLLNLKLLVEPSIALKHDLQRLELPQFALSNCVPWPTCGGAEGDVAAKWYNSVEG